VSMPMATCHHPAKMVFFMSPTLSATRCCRSPGDSYF
jgi:hypothetical protein